MLTFYICAHFHVKMPMLLNKVHVKSADVIHPLVLPRPTRQATVSQQLQHYLSNLTNGVTVYTQLIFDFAFGVAHWAMPRPT